MAHQSNWKRTPLLLAASIMMCGLLLAGCDDRIIVTRDPDIHVQKGNAWVWRPVAPPKDSDKRPVVSRDVISRGETITRDPDADREIVRQRIRTAIEQTLSSKGLKQVSDPQAADTVASVAARMAAGNRGAGVRPKSAMKISASARGRLSLIS